MKRIMGLIAVICMMLFVSVQASGETEYVGRMMVVNCKESVSLRAEPTSASERLDWVPYHTVVENCYSGYGEYYYVEYYGTAGYIHRDYLEVYEGDEYFQPDGYDKMVISNCPEWTPLREMADVNSKMLAKVPLGSVVYDCIYYWDDFTYVHYNGIGGYVLTEYIGISAEVGQEPLLGMKYVTNCTTTVSLREKPSSKSKRLAWVPKDTIVEALAAADGYFYVEYDGQYGYIFGDYLEEMEESYSDADDYLSNQRIWMNSEDIRFAVYLVSDSVGGDWSLVKERNHLDIVLSGLPEEWQPIAMAIPNERVVEVLGGYELYLIIPADDECRVSVERLVLTADGIPGEEVESIYYSETGEPFLLRCNAGMMPWLAEGIMPSWAWRNVPYDCEVSVWGMDDAQRVIWYPRFNHFEGRVDLGVEHGKIFDYTQYDEE